ncbi:hypothetical protein [Neorhizobium galegae]|uniref:hypothetical protein n=1 Tax=Neorhizobium galegae TaxID=399 RepID=UPI000622A4A0|nr:hypothetical protein [Neorhizobium galegae]KAB1125891.1 hypothetical protein F4V90_01830 [Neorhizobium galegae]MCQ1806168.1 hypothetical protein [Neorhizobium galegae]CDZ55495.1 Hypothetical protein NGAL_HAMBI2566_01380 [Neorhizobium galegae bv. orientalis]
MNIMLDDDEILDEVGFIIACQGELTQIWAFPVHIARGLFQRLSKLKTDEDFAPELDAIMEEHEHFAHHIDTRRMDAKLTIEKRWELLADEVTDELLRLADEEATLQ